MRFSVGLRALALLSVLLSQPCSAATLRPLVQLAGPSVRLSDLFAGLRSDQDCVLGDGPVPGARLVIEQPQLEAIAAQFGVDWQPLGSRQAVTIERPGRLLGSEAVAAKLTDALRAQLGSKILVSLSDYQETTIDRDATIGIESVSFDSNSGFLRAELTANANGIETLHVPIDGRVDQLVTLVVPSRPIPAGKMLDAQDLALMDFPASRARGDVLARSEDGVGLVSGRLLSAGIPIQLTSLHRPDLVSRDGPVMIELSANGIAVNAQGRALEAGSMDDRIRVLNPVSRAVLLAVVTGPNQVRIEPGSTPFLADSAGGYPRASAIGLDDEPAPRLAASSLPGNFGR